MLSSFDLQLLEEISQFGERIWEAVGKINFVLWALKRVGESQLRVVLSKSRIRMLPFNDFALFVVDVFAALMPVKLFTLLRNADSHSVIVQAKWLSEVHDVKFYFLTSLTAFFCVSDAEVKPLVMTFGVSVGSHIAVVFMRRLLDYHVQVSRFKLRVEDKLFLRVNARIHTGELSGLFYLLQLVGQVLRGLVLVGGNRLLGLRVWVA